MTFEQLYFIVGGPLIAVALVYALSRLSKPKHPHPGE